ncbi:MAG TPA: EAL domain-containing protein [Stenomitos sp.]
MRDEETIHTATDQRTTEQLLRELADLRAEREFLVGEIQRIEAEAKETIHRLTVTDALTGLPNRTLFHDRLTHALAVARRKRRHLSVLVIDLDRFALVNDTLGHEAGDKLIQAISERLKACLRDCDTVARLGGDEFTVLLTEIANSQDAVLVAQRIVDELSCAFTVHDRELLLTTSIGISVYPSDGEDSVSLVKNANAALYRAKENGNTYQHYTPAMNTASAERLSLDNSLRRALERDELMLYYQPQLDLKTGQVTGAEALIRWRHPDLGLVSPAKFIPLAEDTGLIIPITEWVLKTACAQTQAWHMDGFEDMRISVNLSGKHFKHRNLAYAITHALEETGLPPSCLELELTESILMENLDTTIQVLRMLNHLGIQFSIDDFGTGYSSFSYLKRFPINTVKIDQSFVRDLTASHEDAAIVTAIIAMAHRMRLKVLAEGVETPEQLAFLTGHGCDEMQGFLFSRPIPPEEFRELLRAKRTLKLPA